ncbi:hypothetical protein [Tepidiforma sp.]|jgi:hypothetical protein|uniref:hypothetical protein n=1 Tax=Tepidiforma sp. TaxID=2682230 RepID=UPI00260BA1E9|nr:hypothetical protein [Tepidiforma sp.]MCX7616575.1 SLC19 family protein [Tepidiforma sp.]
MADRIEREIEELLAKLENELPEGGRQPISLEERRRQRRKRRSFPKPSLPAVNPASLLLSGAGIMIAGLFLAMFWSPLIWLSFAGVVIFIAAFLLSFRNRPAGAARGGRPGQVFWRDRYIDYGPPDRGSRFKNPFRRR